MSLKRLSGLFRRKNKQVEAEELQSAQDQRQAIIGEMSENFQSMGSTMEKVQGHLQSNAESMHLLPELIQEQQELCRQVTIAQEANQGLLIKVQEYFEQRDQVQQTLVDHIASMNKQMREDSQNNKDHLQTLVNSYRGSRRMLVLTIALLAMIGTCLLVLLVTLALRPDFLGRPDLLGLPTQAAPAYHQPSANPLILEAQSSLDPVIRERAHQVPVNE